MALTERLLVADGNSSELTNNVKGVYMAKGEKNSGVYGRMGAYDIAVHSNVGRSSHRPENEDIFAIYLPGGVVAVIDGMGGHESGEVAAELTAQAIAKIRQSENSPRNYDLVARIMEGNDLIRDFAQQKFPSLEKSKWPGAVIGAVQVTDSGILKPYHVADVRLYVFDENKNLRYMTKDHTVVQDMLELSLITDEDADPDHNVILRSVGTLANYEQVDNTIQEINSGTILSKRGRFIGDSRKSVSKLRLQPGWQFLILGDGVHEYVSHEYICHAVKTENSPRSLVSHLIDISTIDDVGGKDNATAAAGIYNPTQEQLTLIAENEINEPIQLAPTPTAEIPIVRIDTPTAEIPIVRLAKPSLLDRLFKRK